MDTINIKCPHKDDCDPKPSKHLTVTYIYQKFECLFYHDINGTLETPYRPVSSRTQSEPFDPFCNNCRFAFLNFINTNLSRNCGLCGPCLWENICNLIEANKGGDDKLLLDIQYKTRRPFSQDELLELVPGEVNPTPADETAIEALEKVDAEKLEAAEREQSCMVCLEGIISDSNNTCNNNNCGVIRRMPCKHIFHDDCIVEWLRTSHVCPLCRFELSVDESDNCDEDTSPPIPMYEYEAPFWF